MAEVKKYYWLKLNRGFFKRHDITIIEALENGKDYILFYLKLLCESVDHEGNLRFSDTIPYNEKMLSTLTNTNIDIVKAAMNIFTELNMIEVLDDYTIYMTEVKKMLGASSTHRVKAFRERQKQKKLNAYSDETLPKRQNVTEIEKDIELDIDSTDSKEDIDINNNISLILNTLSPNEKSSDKPYAPKGAQGEVFGESDFEEYNKTLFEYFWKYQVKKVEKNGAAFKAWKKIFTPLKKSKQDMYQMAKKIMQGLKTVLPLWKLQRQNNEIHLIPYPSTWLNGNRWEDDPSVIQATFDSKKAEFEGKAKSQKNNKVLTEVKPSNKDYWG